VSRALQERKEANGPAEFQAELHQTGETVADVRLEIESELAAAAIANKLAKQAARFSDSEIADFYRRNRRLFVKPEEREVQLIEHLPSPTAAVALVRRLGTGPRFAQRALDETLVLNPHENVDQTEKDVTKAIFETRPGVLSRPMRLNVGWSVFIVRRVIPARLKPLRRVRGEAIQRLLALHHRRLTASFEREYSARWRARTRCSRGYVVQKCSGYAGPPLPEERPLPSE
jgi:foldase protein PrsA